jgi:hypothetical protein
MRHLVILITACVLGLGLGALPAKATTGGSSALAPSWHTAMAAGSVPACVAPRVSSTGQPVPAAFASPQPSPIFMVNTVWCCIAGLCYKEATAEICYGLNGDPYQGLTACALACGDP